MADEPEGEKKHYKLEAEPGEFHFSGAEVRAPAINVVGTAHASLAVTMHAEGIVLRPIVNQAENHPMVALIGSVAVHWSQFEHDLDRTLWGLIGGDVKRLSVLTSQVMGATNKVEAIMLLCEERGYSELRAAADALRRAARDVQPLRNRFVHDPWYVEEDSAEAHRAQKMDRTDRAFGHLKTTEGEIRQAITKIKGLIDQARALQKSIDRGRP